mgnify:CR=1 FL=1
MRASAQAHEYFKQSVSCRSELFNFVPENNTGCVATAEIVFTARIYIIFFPLNFLHRRVAWLKI